MQMRLSMSRPPPAARPLSARPKRCWRLDMAMVLVVGSSTGRRFSLSPKWFACVAHFALSFVCAP